jgi:hypothetical protein
VVVDIHFFLNERIEFIRQLYRTASASYVERKRKIEADEEPFVPPCSEDGEPPFLEEWIEADESLHVLACSCVSMLSAALHLYMETWVRQSGVPVEESLKKSVFKKHGWFAGYGAHFSKNFGIKFEAAPVNLGLLEEVVLARNRIEHPSSITSHRTQYTDTDLKKLRHALFVDEREVALFRDANENERAWFIPPTLHVTEEQFLAAISEVARFAEWFEAEIESRVYAR